MSRTSAGDAWTVYAVMDDKGRLVKLVAKDPVRPVASDITAELGKLIADAAVQSTRDSTPK